MQKYALCEIEINSHSQMNSTITSSTTLKVLKSIIHNLH